MDYLKEFQNEIDSLLSFFREELAILRTNRPNPKLIENIRVNYMGEDIRVKELGSITIELPRGLVITLWDKGAIGEAAHAIESANLGVSVSTYENAVRVKLPEATNERREELTKIVKSTAEEVRIRMRIVRDTVNKKINEESDKDIKFKLKEELQKKVNQFNETIDTFVKDKIEEISSL